ncbi:hypothetical protein [Legionella wadsworthii]|uniref:hypothetical protein n=1 Tax=Legionella wadsworthii TaxID=28088 RepID=UPI000A633FE0|nr:hypothetical protein [Legionella wadsworthii]
MESGNREYLIKALNINLHNQSGTFWVHTHAGLQEQEGVYAASISDLPKPPAYHYTKEFAIVLSDWSNTNAAQILATLKKEGDFYSFKISNTTPHLQNLFMTTAKHPKE